MDEHEALIESLRDRLQGSEFYRWAGVELVDASPGVVEVAFDAGPIISTCRAWSMVGSSPRSRTRRWGLPSGRSCSQVGAT